MINLRISIFFISSLIFVWTCHQFLTFGDVLLVKVFLKLECDCDSFCTDDTELSSSSRSSSPEPGCVSSSVRDSINQMVMELKCCTEVHNTVIVKKSSPKNLSADCRSTVGRQVTDSLPTANHQVTDRLRKNLQHTRQSKNRIGR